MQGGLAGFLRDGEVVLGQAYRISQGLTFQSLSVQKGPLQDAERAALLDCRKIAYRSQPIGHEAGIAVFNVRLHWKDNC